MMITDGPNNNMLHNWPCQTAMLDQKPSLHLCNRTPVTVIHGVPVARVFLLGSNGPSSNASKLSVICFRELPPAIIPSNIKK